MNIAVVMLRGSEQPLLAKSSIISSLAIMKFNVPVVDGVPDQAIGPRCWPAGSCWGGAGPCYWASDSCSPAMRSHQLEGVAERGWPGAP
ncbi:hypothetical protein E2C01_028944 [Portunus trituberculatus]|uniref:Uncharacterized protein n=1 Tax=Portunus trituberculatus TaxID=210409 RepID=A0A5B7EQW4_PORTR|nr:hypothetical protein [Portunus trituberculatus]